MTLTEWIDERVEKYGSRHAVHCHLAEVLEKAGTPVTRPTIYDVDRGMKLAHYGRAKALSEATKGEVSIAELCE